MNFSNVLTELAEAIMKADEARDINRSREPFLRIPFQFLPENQPAAVGLWLIDETGGTMGYEATLWQIVTRQESESAVTSVVMPDSKPAVVPVDPEALKQGLPLKAQGQIREAFPINLEDNRVRRLFAASFGRKTDFTGYHDVLLPLQAQKSERYVGVLQLIAPDIDLVRELEKNSFELAAVSEMIAALIEAGRRRRQISAIDTCQKSVLKAKSSRELAKALSHVLLTACSALSCAIYRPGRGDCLELFAEAPEGSHVCPATIERGSFTYWIYERSNSDGNRQNLKHFSKLAASELEPGAPAVKRGIDLAQDLNPEHTSWLSYAVLSPAGAGLGEQIPILFIRLLTAPHRDFLGGSFSHTARAIVSTLGAYVAELFSNLFFSEAVAVLAEKAPLLRDKFPGYITKPDLLGLECEYGNLIKELIRSISNVYIAQRFDASGNTALRRCNKEIAPGMAPFAWSTRKSVGVQAGQILSYQPYNGRDGVDITVNAVDSCEYGLRCVCAGRPIALYEWRVLEYVVQELRFAELSTFDMAEKARQAGEIRHALRAELGGALGHLSVASDIYELSLTTHRSGDTATAARLLLEDAKFRKSMKRAVLSSESLKTVLENTSIHMNEMSSDKLQRSKIDLARMVKEMRIPYMPELDRRNLEVIDKSQGPVWASCDSRLIRMALFNLFDNAVKYAYSKNPITIQANDHGSHVSVVVTNIGPHIATADFKKIFEPFQRVTFKGVQPMPGTGLGLPVSKKIAEVHGGQIEVKSEQLVAGDPTRAVTTFTLRIPKG